MNIYVFDEEIVWDTNPTDKEKIIIAKVVKGLLLSNNYKSIGDVNLKVINNIRGAGYIIQTQCFYKE